MSQKQSLERIRSLVKRHRPGAHDASFRNEYKTALSDGLRQGSLTQEDADLLAGAKTSLEAWTGKSPPAGGEAIAQWLAFYEAGKERFSIPLFEAFLRRLPKVSPKDFDWAPLLLRTRDKHLVEMLVARRIIKTSEFTRIAKANSSQFYSSASLDVLLDHGVPAPRAVWDDLAKGEPRPNDLLAPNDALARSFAADRRSDASAWMVRYLAKSLGIRQAVLRHLLRDSIAALRLVRYLASAGMSPTGKKRKTQQALIAPVITDLLVVCELAISEHKRTAATAMFILGFLQLSSAASSIGFADEARTAIEESASRISHGAIVQALREAEESGTSAQRPEVLVVQSGHLYSAVQEYLRRLPPGADGEMQSPERALRNERYLGRREVIQGLISTFDGATEPSALRDAIEAVLFNAGVRPLGAAGETSIFEVRTHEPETSGILPGDTVTITRPGWRLGDEESGVVLIKARARPADQTQTRRSPR